MVEILNETYLGRPKTPLMRKCNLNYKQMEIYTQILLEKKLLDKEFDENGQVGVIVTQRGKDFVRDFRVLKTKMT